MFIFVAWLAKSHAVVDVVAKRRVIGETLNMVGVQIAALCITA
jgi:hypothetical protein